MPAVPDNEFFQRSQRYRAYLTPAQAAVSRHWLAASTWFYNEASRSQQDRWHRYLLWRANPWKYPKVAIENRYGLAAGVRAARDSGCTFWHEGTAHLIATVPAVILHGALADLAASWNRHLAVTGKMRSRPPGFRSLRNGGSFRWQVQENGGRRPGGKVIRRAVPGGRWAQASLLQGLGLVKIRHHRPLPDDALVGNIILKEDALGQHWLILQYLTRQVRQPAGSGTGGVDRGVAVTAATSGGQVYNMPALSPGRQRRIAKLQADLARKRRLRPCRHDRWVAGRDGHPKLLRGRCPVPAAPGDCWCWKHSRRYALSRRALQKLQQRTRDQRLDAAHKASRSLADCYATVVMENLDVSAMSRSARGTKEKPGRKVRQKAGLNRGILASNWYQLEQFTGYKAAALVKVAARNTSLTCPRCGHVSGENRPRRDVFRCISCGLQGHADIIAASNIRALHAAPAAAAQAVEAQEISSGLMKAAEPANRHHNTNTIHTAHDHRERRGSDRVPGERSPAGQEANIVTRVTGPLIPPAWGIAPPAQLRKRPGQKRRKPRALSSGIKDGA
jgi:putative transposase